MGLRFRLKAGVNIGAFSHDTQVILTALKKYGMILADNGSSWFVTGARDSRWDDNDLGQLKTVPGSAFEVVSTGERDGGVHQDERLFGTIEEQQRRTAGRQRLAQRFGQTERLRDDQGLLGVAVRLLHVP